MYQVLRFSTESAFDVNNNYVLRKCFYIRSTITQSDLQIVARKKIHKCPWSHGHRLAQNTKERLIPTGKRPLTVIIVIFEGL